MGKVPVRLRELVYTLSPFQQTVMGGLWKDAPAKLARKFSEVREKRERERKRRGEGRGERERERALFFTSPPLSLLSTPLPQNWFDVGVFFLAPTWATMAYAAAYKEKEKMDHRN